MDLVPGGGEGGNNAFTAVSKNYDFCFSRRSVYRTARFGKICHFVDFLRYEGSRCFLTFLHPYHAYQGLYDLSEIIHPSLWALWCVKRANFNQYKNNFFNVYSRRLFYDHWTVIYTHTHTCLLNASC